MAVRGLPCTGASVGCGWARLDPDEGRPTARVLAALIAAVVPHVAGPGPSAAVSVELPAPRARDPARHVFEARRGRSPPPSQWRRSHADRNGRRWGLAEQALRSQRVVVIFSIGGVGDGGRRSSDELLDAEVTQARPAWVSDARRNTGEWTPDRQAAPGDPPDPAHRDRHRPPSRRRLRPPRSARSRTTWYEDSRLRARGRVRRPHRRRRRVRQATVPETPDHASPPAWASRWRAPGTPSSSCDHRQLRGLRPLSARWARDWRAEHGRSPAR